MIQKINIVSDVFCIAVEIHNQPITLFNLNIFIIEEAAAALVIKYARDLILNLPLLIHRVNQMDQPTHIGISLHIVDGAFGLGRRVH